MRIDKIHYEELFTTGQFQNQRYRAEISLDDTDSPEVAFTIAQMKVREAFQKLNPQLQLGTTTTEVVTPEVPLFPKTNEQQKKSAEERMIEAINSCTELKVLETYKLLAKSNPKYQEAYNQKLQSLTK